MKIGGVEGRVVDRSDVEEVVGNEEVAVVSNGSVVGGVDRMGRGSGRVSLPEKGRKRLEEERRQERASPSRFVLYGKIQFVDGVLPADAAEFKLRTISQHCHILSLSRQSFSSWDRRLRAFSLSFVGLRTAVEAFDSLSLWPRTSTSG